MNSMILAAATWMSRSVVSSFDIEGSAPPRSSGLSATFAGKSRGRLGTIAGKRGRESGKHPLETRRRRLPRSGSEIGFRRNKANAEHLCAYGGNALSPKNGRDSAANEAIDERPVVKRGGADFESRAPAHPLRRGLRVNASKTGNHGRHGSTRKGNSFGFAFPCASVPSVVDIRSSRDGDPRLATSADNFIAGLLGMLNGPPPESPLPSYRSRPRAGVGWTSRPCSSTIP